MQQPPHSTLYLEAERHADGKKSAFQLNLVAQFPNRPPVVIEHLGAEPVARKKSSASARRARAAA